VATARAQAQAGGCFGGSGGEISGSKKTGFVISAVGDVDFPGVLGGTTPPRGTEWREFRPHNVAFIGKESRWTCAGQFPRTLGRQIGKELFVQSVSGAPPALRFDLTGAVSFFTGARTKQQASGERESGNTWRGSDPAWAQPRGAGLQVSFVNAHGLLDHGRPAWAKHGRGGGCQNQIAKRHGVRVPHRRTVPPVNPRGGTFDESLNISRGPSFSGGPPSA